MIVIIVSRYAKALFQEVRGKNVKVSVICPGMVSTDLGSQIQKDFDGYIVGSPENFLQVTPIHSVLLSSTLFVIMLMCVCSQKTWQML